MSELLFIRHGETDWNRQQRFQGQIDVPLNATGQAQAAALAARLGRTPAPAAGAFVTSDLVRARQTAAPLAAAWRLEPAVAPGLREQSFGEWEGLDAAAIQARWPTLWPRWLEHGADFAPPGGESARQFHTRVLTAVRALEAQTGGGQPLVVVTHGGVLDMLWRTAHGVPLDGLRRCAIPNTGLNRLRWAAGALQVEQWADAAHLDGVGGLTAPLAT